MRKIISLMLALSMIMVIGVNVSAVGVAEETPALEQKEAILVSVKTISNKEADALLPEEIRQTLTVNSGVMPLGSSAPSKNALWDLTEEGTRYFHATVTLLYPVYSSYCYTGHDGAIELKIFEDTKAASGKTFDFEIQKRGLVDTKVYTFVCFYYAGTTISRIDDFDADDLIYFKIPYNLKSDINITSNSFIAKA